MTRHNTVRTVLPILVAGLALAACGGDEEPPPDPAGAAGGTTTEPESSASEDSSTDPGGSEAPLGEEDAAACTELETIADDITSAFPEGVGLNPGVVPDDQQAGALSALADQYAAVDMSDENLGSLRDAVVAAAETLLERADVGEPIEEADADAFNSSFADLGIRCESAR
ncbi:MAG: hypothetical protein WKH47_03780 [Actinomycetes bacterium]